jgi:hypothetical protein
MNISLVLTHELFNAQNSISKAKRNDLTNNDPPKDEMAGQTPEVTPEKESESDMQ